jgi:hypothetical protein
MKDRLHRLRVLTAVEAVAADPVRLAHALHEAVDDEDAGRRVATAFGLEPELAAVVLDQQIRTLAPSLRARRAEEIRVLAAEWGPPVAVDAHVTGRSRLVLSVEGTEHHIRGRGTDELLERLNDLLVEQVARPRLRPVIATVTGLRAGPMTWTVTPDGSGSRGPDAPAGRQRQPRSSTPPGTGAAGS